MYNNTTFSMKRKIAYRKGAMKDFISKITFGFLMAQLLPGAVEVIAFTCMIGNNELESDTCLKQMLGCIDNHWFRWKNALIEIKNPTLKRKIEEALSINYRLMINDSRVVEICAALQYWGLRGIRKLVN